MAKKIKNQACPITPPTAKGPTLMELLAKGFPPERAREILAAQQAVVRTPPKKLAVTKVPKVDIDAMVQAISAGIERKPFEFIENHILEDDFSARIKSWMNPHSSMGQSLSELDRAILTGAGRRADNATERMQAIADRNPNVPNIERISFGAKFSEREFQYQVLCAQFNEAIQKAYETHIANQDSSKFSLSEDLVNEYYTKILEHLTSTLRDTLGLTGDELNTKLTLIDELLRERFELYFEDLNDELIQANITTYYQALSDLLINIATKALHQQGLGCQWYHKDPGEISKVLFFNIVGALGQEHRRVGKLEIPVKHQFNLDPRVAGKIIISSGGSLYINLEDLELSTIVNCKNSRNFRYDFNGLFNAQHDFSFIKDPEKLETYFMAASLEPDEKEDSYRNKIREEALLKAETELLMNAFIETKYQAEYPANQKDYWLHNIAIIEDELRRNLLLPGSIAKEAYESFMADHSYQVTETINNTELVFLNKSIMVLEGRLRQLMQSENPALVILDGLAGIIFPFNSNEETSKQDGGKKIVSTSIDKILLARLLTETLLGDEGKELSKLVQWNDLLCEGKSPLTHEANFKDEWNEYLKNPDEYIQQGKDPQALMRLRAIWYKFFDKNMGRFDRYTAFCKTGAIKKAAETAWQENFLSYSQRQKAYDKYVKSGLESDWTKVYRRDLAF